MRKGFVAGFAVAMLLAAAMTASWGAVEIAPVPWRGEPGTTYADWQFGTNSNPAVPDDAANPYGSSSLQITVGEFASGWQQQLSAMGSQTGYWDLGSAGTMIVDLAGPPAGFTDIVLQVVCYEDITAVPVCAVSGAQLISQDSWIVESIDSGGRWRTCLSQWSVLPSAGPVVVQLSSDPDWGAVVSRVVVDTNTEVVPEPASCVVLLTGLAVFLTRRRPNG